MIQLSLSAINQCLEETEHGIFTDVDTLLDKLKSIFSPEYCYCIELLTNSASDNPMIIFESTSRIEKPIPCRSDCSAGSGLRHNQE